MENALLMEYPLSGKFLKTLKQKGKVIKCKT